MKTTSKNLHDAKRNKNDEFYTMLKDIEKELQYYEHHFKDKIIYSNCDGSESNFVKFFQDNKDRLGYKEFLYSSSDFRQNLDLLERADIIITNPPFSLFRDFISLIEKYNKKYLVIGNMNAVTYKEVFGLIKSNRLWLGINQCHEFIQPDGSKKKFGNIGWFTNLEHNKRAEKIDLYKKYSKEDYPIYDNYDAIEVSKTCEIPEDYDGIMGVPISFLSKYNPEQFEIVRFRKGNDEKDLSINERCPYFRVLIKRKISENKT